MQIYLTCQQNLQLETALTQLTYHAQRAAAIFQYEIKHAGNIGCARLTPDFPLFPYENYQLNASNKISSSQQNEITIRYAEYPNTIVVETVTDKNRIYLNNKIHFKPGNILLIADCNKAEVIIVRSVKQVHYMQEITLTKPLQYQYAKFTEVSRLILHRFFVRKSKHKPYANALFYEDIYHKQYEVLSNVNEMHVSHDKSYVKIMLRFDMQGMKKTWYYENKLI